VTEKSPMVLERPGRSALEAQPVVLQLIIVVYVLVVYLYESTFLADHGSASRSGIGCGAGRCRLSMYTLWG